MRILFYTDTPNIGGAEKQMLLLAKYLSKKGHQISLAYGAYSKIQTLHDEFARYCETIFVLPVIHKHDPRHFFRLKEILRAENFDLIHIHLWNPGAGRYAFYAAALSNTPIVTTEHDPFELSGLKRIIKQKCLQKTRKMIVVSRDNEKQMEEIYGVAAIKLHQVHNGIEVEPFLDNRDKAILPVTPGDLAVTCIAELHPRKGQKYLIQAFQKLSQEIPQLHLILVGTGPQEAELKKEYESVPKLHFLGWRKDIAQILRASDLFVLPSLKEAFGLVILEAMASGVAVIGTNAGGIPDMIEQGKTGYLVPPASSEKIAEAILTLLRNPNQKRDIETEAQKRVCENFTAEKMAAETEKVYELALSAGA